MDNIENHKKVFVLISENSGNEYSIIISKDMDDNSYRIINLTTGHICPSKFDTYEACEDDIYRHQSEGKFKISDIYPMII